MRHGLLQSEIFSTEVNLTETITAPLTSGTEFVDLMKYFPDPPPVEPDREIIINPVETSRKSHMVDEPVELCKDLEIG